MKALLQALQIIFEIQRKNNNEKITRRKISFPNNKNALFFFPFFGTPRYLLRPNLHLSRSKFKSNQGLCIFL
jgi:hypothetical protein